MASPVVVVLGASILVQVASAVVGLYLIRASGYLTPWLFISAAIVLMALSRVITFVDIARAGWTSGTNLGPEIVALVISILMMTGLILLQAASERVELRADRQQGTYELVQTRIPRDARRCVRSRRVTPLRGRQVHAPRLGQRARAGGRRGRSDQRFIWPDAHPLAWREHEAAREDQLPADS